ncbi:neuronal pentraxin-1 [Hoplias malabaricus]|uniref:neuronal pentraxin-1 n=1 Tax=Hoplias malabaricus TaxID=27720 RepID=UPI003462DD82
MMVKDTNIAILPLLLPFKENMHRGRIPRGSYPLPLPLFPILLLSVMPSVGLSNVPGVEYDWGAQPKLVCTPIPADADPSCFPPAGVTTGPSTNGHSNGHSNGQYVSGLPNSRRGMSDEAKATILHLRESLVRQKETILDQRETIRELTTKLTLCEGFGRGTGGHHDEDHHGSSHHGSHHSSHHYDGAHHSDPHYPLNGHRNDHHRGKSPYLSKHGFSPEQAGKTLQALKERLENLQARNSSSSYSSSLRDLLQRKINSLEEQLHHHYDGHHDHGHESQHGHGHHDDHNEDHHDNHGDHHDDHQDNRHANHHDDHDHGHHYNQYSGHRYDRHSTHHSDHHDNHHDDHDDNHHDDNHDDDHHGTADHGNQHRAPQKQTGSKIPAHGAHSKLDTVLSHLYHRPPEAGTLKKSKSPDAFQIGFPMRTNYMYGRIKRTLLNEIFALTVCLWVKGGSGPGLGTPFSYSVPGQANELVLIEWGNNPMELLVNDKAVTLPLSLTDSKWHHLCVTWSTRDGVWEAYQNGVKRGSGENLSPWHPIKPGGVFILGQEQDTLGGRFDATQSFVGEMSDLQLWSRVLNSEEIYNQASCSSHLTGDVIAWSEPIVELHGGVTKYPFDPCH